MADITKQLVRAEFPRSARYDAEWMMDNQMGPNALWLLEWLCESLDLKPGMRVLDLGCGKAMTSIVLAKEFGRCYSMVTTAASPLMAPIHDRKPALLLPSEAADFLKGGPWTFLPFAGPLTVTPCASPLARPQDPDGQQAFKNFPPA